MGSRSWQLTLQAACSMQLQWAKRRRGRRGGEADRQGSSSAPRLLQVKCPKRADTSLNWSWDTNSIGWRSACAATCQLSQRAQSGAESGVYVCIVWHAACVYFVGGRTGSHLSIGSKRCHKGARQRKQSKADTYVNQTRLPPPPSLATRPRAPLAPSPSAAPSPLFDWAICIYSNQASAEQEVQAKSCSNFHAGTNCRRTHTPSHTLTHTLTHPWALNTLTD